MRGNHTANSLQARRRLLQSLGAGTAAGAATLIPGRWARPVVDSVILPAHAQTSAPDADAPSTLPASAQYSLSIDSVGTSSLGTANCDNASPSGENFVRVNFTVEGWSATLNPAPPPGTDLHVRGLILSIQGTDLSQIAPGTTCSVDQAACVTPFDSDGGAVDNNSARWVVSSDAGFDGPGAPGTVEYGIEFSVPSLPQVRAQTISLATVPLSSNCFD